MGAAIRDEKGRFVKGHADQGAGRKPRATEDDFLALIDDAVSPGDWTDIINKAKSQAKRGDAVARAWLTDRRFGKAKQPNELTGKDGNALEVVFREVVIANND